MLDVGPLPLACACAVTAFLLVLARRREVAKPARTSAHAATRALGKRSGVRVSVLGQGGAPLGDLYRKIDDGTALGALAVAHDAGITYYDSSPWYGVGLSEMRCGLALHRVPRSSFVFQTKVGRYLVPDPAAKNGTSVGWLGGLHMGVRFDYSAAALERQLEDSLQRTGLGYIDSLVLHDCEPTPHRDPAKGGARAGARTHDLAARRPSSPARSSPLAHQSRLRAPTRPAQTTVSPPPAATSPRSSAAASGRCSGCVLGA